jgi:hypothetical protein
MMPVISLTSPSHFLAAGRTPASAPTRPPTPPSSPKYFLGTSSQFPHTTRLPASYLVRSRTRPPYMLISTLVGSGCSTSRTRVTVVWLAKVMSRLCEEAKSWAAVQERCCEWGSAQAAGEAYVWKVRQAHWMLARGLGEAIAGEVRMERRAR